MESLTEHLQRAFDLAEDLVSSLTSEDLKLRLGNLPSNSIGEQIWCIIGARESYLKAVINGRWIGFSCSLDDTNSQEKILGCLKKSKEDVLNFVLDRRLSEGQVELLMDLLEHEVQHHGQLIRYIYGNGLKFPESWHERYSV